MKFLNSLAILVTLSTLFSAKVGAQSCTTDSDCGRPDSFCTQLEAGEECIVDVPQIILSYDKFTKNIGIKILTSKLAPEKIKYRIKSSHMAGEISAPPPADPCSFLTNFTAYTANKIIPLSSLAPESYYIAAVFCDAGSIGNWATSPNIDIVDTTLNPKNGATLIIKSSPSFK